MSEQNAGVGTRWIEQTPSHWKVDRLKWSISRAVNGIWGDEPEGVEDILCVRVADFDRDRFRVNPPPTFRAVAQKDRVGRLLRAGDLLIEKSGGGDKQLVGCVVSCELNTEAVCSNFVARLVPAPAMDPRYWTYVHATIYSARIHLPAIKQTTGIQNLDLSAYLDVVVPYPPENEQRRIADYLDRETARIDALIAAKQRLLDLIAEKRKALITQAVTQGLDPNVPKKPSGISWLGDIPVHWDVGRLKFHLSRMEQGWSPQCESTEAGEQEWGVMKAGCVNGWEFNAAENKRLPPELEPPLELEIQPGDILISRANTTELVGSAVLVGPVRPRLLLCDKLFRLRVNPACLLPEYLVTCLRSPVGRFQFERDATGASNSMQNIGQDSVRELWLPIPPRSEQSAITDHLIEVTATLNRITEATEATVSLLLERRAALIATAVTGQIPIPSESEP